MGGNPGPSPNPAPTSGGQQQQKERDRKKGKDQQNHRFKGCIDGLEQAVFNAQGGKTSDAFNISLRKIAEHIARTVRHAGEFRQALNPDELGFIEIMEPSDPASGASAVDIKKWETKHRNWNEDKR